MTKDQKKAEKKQKSEREETSNKVSSQSLNKDINRDHHTGGSAGQQTNKAPHGLLVFMSTANQGICHTVVHCS